MHHNDDMMKMMTIILMSTSCCLQLVWIFILLAMVVASFTFVCWTSMCNRLYQMNKDKNDVCLDLTQFGFLLPEVSLEHQVICNEGKKKEFCNDFVSLPPILLQNPLIIHETVFVDTCQRMRANVHAFICVKSCVCDFVCRYESPS